MTTVLKALNAALHFCLAEDPGVYFLGEDVLDPYGGAFKVSQGLSTAYADRVIATPISEGGIVGLGVGMALRGLRPVVEIMFGDFITLAMDQLINHAAKMRWMSNDRVRVPLVVRTPMGGRRGYGPTHSQTLEKHLLGAPGLRVIAACTLDDPGGLLQKAVLRDDDPVLFIEHKLMYTRGVLALSDLEEWQAERTDGVYPAYRLRIAGAPAPTITVATYGYMAEMAREAALRLAYQHEVFTELVVYTQLSPFEPEPVLESLRRTGRLLALEEGGRTLGWGAEVLAQAVEGDLGGLRAARVAARDMPIPAAAMLEAQVLPQADDILQAALDLARK